MNAPIEGEVRDAAACRPLSDVRVEHRDAAGHRKSAYETRVDGRWRLADVEPGDTTVFSKLGYVAKSYGKVPVPPMVRLIEDRIIGYHDRLTVDPGATLAARVHATVPYEATLFRYGLERERILSCGEMPSSVQQVPDGLFVAAGLDWPEAFSYTIPDNARPGLYGLQLRARADEFVIPLIVSSARLPVERRARLLVISSTSTWQAYNIWGGRSVYRNFEQFTYEGAQPLNRVGPFRRLANRAVTCLPAFLYAPLRRAFAVRSEPWRFDRLAVNRPVTNCDLEATEISAPFTNHLAAAEWRTLGWLERQGYDYDVASCYDLDRQASLFQTYRGVLLTAHAEYWSRAMFDTVREFHEKERGWLINCGGNAIYREIAYDDDESMRCVSMSFRDSVGDETRLLGVRFSEEDVLTAAGYRIRRPDHWIFKGIELAPEGVFGRECLNGGNAQPSDDYKAAKPMPGGCLSGTGASGWETDKRSRTAPRDIIVVAKGLNPGGGAEMVVREPAGTRGGMFSASSMTFSGSLPVDDVTSRLFGNVLDRVLE